MGVAAESHIPQGTAPGAWWGRRAQELMPGINVGQAERWLSAAAGGLLTAYGLKHRTAGGGLAAVAGMALLFRGATGHCNVYQAFGINRANGHGHAAIADRDSDTRRQLGGARGIHVDESITINRPVSQVFRFWRNLENLPKFMRHLEQVAVREEGISHWIASGPAGARVEWDARIINEVDDKIIGWQSLDGSMVSTAGSVNFSDVGGATRVRVHLQYNPPGGRLGAAVARLFGEEPTQQIREDLRRFKSLMETGEIPRAT